MKVIIAGSRNCNSYLIVCKAIIASNYDVNYGITEIVSGMARGVDLLGKEYGDRFDIPVIPFHADWDGPYKKLAGFVRNEEMAKYATHLIAIWDGVSSGTADMIKRAKKHNLAVFIYYYKEIPQ